MTMVDEVKAILRQEMDSRGWHNDDWRAGLAAIVGGESGFIPKRELGWKHTANERIRRFFSKTRNLSDDELDRLKSSDVTWFNFLYGGRYGNGPNDGFTYRGGGLNQLTFKDNYKRYGGLVGVDLVAHPEMIDVPRIAAAVAVEYMKDRFQGGDFDAMKKAVGVSLGEPNAEKNRLYALYRRTGEWDYRPEVAPTVVAKPPEERLDPIVRDFLLALQNAEKFLAQRGLYTGPIDHDPGPSFRAALKAYVKGV